MNNYEEYLEKHYLEIYEEYCRRHPEEITSDFILEEDGNEDYIDEIINDMQCNIDSSNYNSLMAQQMIDSIYSSKN